MPKSKIHSASILAEQKPPSECGSQQQEEKILLNLSISPKKRKSEEELCRLPNEVEICQLNDLRKILAPQLAKHTNRDVDDGYLLRWLRSKEGRFDETADVGFCCFFYTGRIKAVFDTK